MSEKRSPMRCMSGIDHCDRDVSRVESRPVWTEAICWRCWYEMYGKAQAVREWKARRWWRGLVP